MKKTVETIKKQWLDASYQELHQVARQQVKLYMEELNVLYQQQTGYGFLGVLGLAAVAAHSYRGHDSSPPFCWE